MARPDCATLARPGRDAVFPNITAVGVTRRAGFPFEIKAIARLPQGAA